MHLPKSTVAQKIFPSEFEAMTVRFNFPVQVPWMSTPTRVRFAYAECIETSTWEEISRKFLTSPHLFTSGPLHTFGLADENFKMWACFKGHPCLHKILEFPYTDAMCYAYHEKELRWYPWALESEAKKNLKLCL